MILISYIVIHILMVKNKSIEKGTESYSEREAAIMDKLTKISYVVECIESVITKIINYALLILLIAIAILLIICIIAIATEAQQILNFSHWELYSLAQLVEKFGFVSTLITIATAVILTVGFTIFHAKSLIQKGKVSLALRCAIGLWIIALIGGKFALVWFA